MWVFILIISLVVYLIYKYLNHGAKFFEANGIPMSKEAGILTFFLQSKSLVEWDMAMYKDIKSRTTNGIGGLLEFGKPQPYLIDLELIKKIYIKDFDHFVNRRSFETSTGDHASDMLTTQQNDKWRNLRGTLSPIFTTGKIRRMFDIFDQVGTEFGNYLKSKEGQDIDIRDAMGRYTMSVVSAAVFGLNCEAFNDNKSSDFILMGKKFMNFESALRVLKFFFVVSFPKVAQALNINVFDIEADNYFASVIKKAIHERSKNPDVKWNDFLELMLETQKGKLKEEEVLDTFEKDAQLTNSGRQKVQMTERMIVAQSILFLLAGFDTTETMLIWAAYELALNPDVQNKLYEEVNKVHETDGKLNFDALNKMEYLELFVSETLRKFPPAFRTERKVEKDYKIEGTKIVLTKGMIVQIPIYSIHHDEDYYPEHDKFIPERFTAENKATRHPYSYMPFGHGPRNCIGMRFALTETKVAICHLVHNFFIEPTAKTTIPPKFSKSTMKPLNGMFLKLSPRN